LEIYGYINFLKFGKERSIEDNLKYIKNVKANESGMIM
jgi:hypothetical protein